MNEHNRDDRSVALDDALLPRPRIMGVLNVTPDSFSDGGRYAGTDAAVEHGIRLADEGADIIDVGGESTRPPGDDYGAGAARVNEGEEIARVAPVIERLHALRPQVAISVDTMKPGVAAAALEAGATMVNDVSAARYDAAILDVAAAHGAAYVAMHGYDPADRAPLEAHRYADVVAETFAFLAERIALAIARGVRQVIGDVGIGFAKGAADSERLLREHERFLALGVPMLVGASRKSFIGRALGGVPVEERLYGTLAAHAVAFLHGASIVRVHDVRAAREFFQVFGRLRFPGAP